ncbi:tetratricopeptide repeat protein [Caenimonas sedimenti]|uniref:Tetratricopeptide repeat protein n=1 Tax=Caenimonas sedimenti TaxID=2596921 RepID=A0A562ZFL1_9BURK|nr:TonB-dependent receptor [Caenimonas sedimenti]TWO66679.1 tetratricopeptide repeat protein [Caenimonas sedimenti]
MNTRSDVHRFALHCIAAASLAVASTGATAAVPAGAAAEIVNLQGAGEQKAAAAPDWRPARMAQPLANGDYVRTRDAARMAILFADETQIRLHANTVLQVKAVAAGAQASTTLSLEAGRAWAQTRRPPGVPLNFQTPAATAGIRGTDWDIQVDADGKTLLTVLSGEVTLSNPQGEVIVGRNEAAVAEVGKAPVKILLSQPRDRIQWVNALKAEPERFRGLEPALADLLARAERQLVDGESGQSIATLTSGLARFPGHPVLRAELARAQLLGDRLDESARTLGEPRADDPAPLWLSRGALARRQGDAPGTLRAYGRATELAPQDDRGWFGLGSAHTEREDSVPARASLLRALELNPQGPGYRGELGTLEAFRNDIPAAEQAFSEALAANPSDYVALTGQGLLRLKQGRPDAALDAFLRAGVMEPRYARAKTYTAVAYYQLGRHSDAVATLEQAALLDDKDPLPHLFLAQIHTDLFRAGDAVQASRAAVQRMPYLKSLNQLANDQQGRANFGASLAFFGMEDWALELAQQSYHPYWGGSHLFLADRYPGEFNKNSELFQGFLADPLAFGGSQRFSPLLQRPGHHGAVGITLDREHFRLAAPSVTFNGLVNTHVPIAYFVKAQTGVATRLPIDVGTFGVPAFYDSSGRADARIQVGTIGLGAQPTANLGLFFYANDIDLSLRGRNQVFFLDDAGAPTTLDNRVRQAALGASYRWSPTSQTWAKLGHSTDFNEVARYPTQFPVPPLVGVLGLASIPQKRFSDLQLRHTMDLDNGDRVWGTIEHVKERQFNQVAGAGPIFGEIEGVLVGDTLVFTGRNDVDRRYNGLTLAWQQAATSPLRFDGALAAHWIRHRVHGQNAAALINLEFLNRTLADRDDTERVVAPRVGLVWQPHSGLTVRAAYQHFLRPLATSTLASVDTAGLPVEDRYLEAGGQSKRGVVQAALALGDRTFALGRLEHTQVRNPTAVGVDLRTPSLLFLEEMRNAQLVNLSTLSLLEGDPIVQRGHVSAATFGLNHMFTKQWSGYARYAYHHSDSVTEDTLTNAEIPDRQFPWLPRHTAVVGGTWASAERIYFSARAVFRSRRFEDTANLTVRPSGWGVDLAGFWESADKHWVIGAGALNLFGNRSERQVRRYVIDARYRF